MKEAINETPSAGFGSNTKTPRAKPRVNPLSKWLLVLMGALLLVGLNQSASAACAPTIIGQLSLGSEGIGNYNVNGIPTTDMKVLGDLAFVSVNGGNGNPGKLLIINAANPTSPQLLSTWYAPDFVTLRSVAVSGNYVYIGGQSRFYVIDVSNPASPFRVGSYIATGDVQLSLTKTARSTSQEPAPMDTTCKWSTSQSQRIQ